MPKKIIKPQEVEVIEVKTKTSNDIKEEVVENVVVSDDAAAKRKLRRLRHLGYR
jgi:hypothetical protein